MLNRILGRKSQSKKSAKSPRVAPPSPFAKLRLETLESREVPSAANFWWDGSHANGSYTEATNWYTDGDHAYPVNGDNLIFGASPAEDDPTIFGGEPPSEPTEPTYYNCTIPTGSQFTSFAGVHLLSGYTATVTFQNATTVGDFDLNNGAIKQASAGSELTITHYLSFLGGTLNSGTALSTVHITGKEGMAATANLLPPDNGSLTIGSTISLEGLGTETGGSGMAMFSGHYNWLNDADDIVGEYCVQEVKPKLPYTINDPEKLTITDVRKGNKEYKKFEVLKGGVLNFKVDADLSDAILIVRPGAWCGVYDVKLELGAPPIFVSTDVPLKSIDVQSNEDGAVGHLILVSSKGKGEIIAIRGITISGEFVTKFDPNPTIATRPVATVIATTNVAERGLTIEKRGTLVVGGTGAISALALTGELNVAGAILIDLNCGEAIVDPVFFDNDFLSVSGKVTFSKGSAVDISEKSVNGQVTQGRVWTAISSGEEIAKPDDGGLSNTSAYATELSPNKKDLRIKKN